MNREIKFRAWNFKTKEMFSPEVMAEDQMSMLPTGQFINVHSIPRMSVIYPLTSMLPLQYTGLKDKNGKEIYEGDIVRHFFVGKPQDVNLYKVVFNHARYLLFRTFEDTIDLDNNSKYEVIEVIGNIYENPELAS